MVILRLCRDFQNMSFSKFVLISLFVLSFAKGDPPSSPDLLMPSFLYSTNISDTRVPNCPPFESILNAVVQIKNDRGSIAAVITCHENYSLIGRNIIYCDDGAWSLGFDEVPPKCVKRCPPPPYLEHGDVTLEKLLEDVYTPTGTYLKGTTARYTCIEGYILEPASSSSRVCENGHWTGTDAFCKPNMDVSCVSPPVIENGFMQPSFPIGYSLIAVGQEVMYQCVVGYKLVGSEKIQCTDVGIWVPEAPSCHKDTDLFPTISCASIPLLDPKVHARIEIGSISKTTVELGCQANYQNSLAPCQMSKFYCKNGKWVGVYPLCVEVHMCSAPPAIPYAVVINRNFDGYDSNGLPFFPINAQITFECLKGYILDGGPVISCQSNGCWEPAELWPTCIRAKENYFIELNNLNAILISSATGAAVLGILLLACLVVACKKRKAIARAVTASNTTTNSITRHSPEVGNDHAILLQHPDRLALIAFADGVQNSQNNCLPSYDEATRDRSTLIQVSRLQIQRPHWPNLAICRGSGRNRGSPNPNLDSGHRVARHGSSASHTPSMRSGGESMGSTDTVTISEGSTNVTLDTASSHSAVSQNPSCRGHCGSLASFDACSMINTEGVPLLEESELEEIQGGSNDVDNPAISDNTSSKISTHSAPLMTN